MKLSNSNKGCWSPQLICCLCLEHTVRSSARLGVHTYLQAGSLVRRRIRGLLLTGSHLWHSCIFASESGIRQGLHPGPAFPTVAEEAALDPLASSGHCTATCSIKVSCKCGSQLAASGDRALNYCLLPNKELKHVSPPRCASIRWPSAAGVLGPMALRLVPNSPATEVVRSEIPHS